MAWGATPLFVAAKNGHVEIVRLLLHSESVLSKSKSPGGPSTDFGAHSERNCSEWRPSLELRLFSNGSCLSSLFGSTPLLVAAQNNHVAVVEILVLFYKSWFNLKELKICRSYNQFCPETRSESCQGPRRHSM